MWASIALYILLYRSHLILVGWAWKTLPLPTRANVFKNNCKSNSVSILDDFLKLCILFYKGISSTSTSFDVIRLTASSKMVNADSLTNYGYITASWILAASSILPALNIFVVALWFYARRRQRVRPGLSDWVIVLALVRSSTREHLGKFVDFI